MRSCESVFFGSFESYDLKIKNFGVDKNCTKQDLRYIWWRPLVGIAEEIATRLGWSVVCRTGERFMNTLPELGSNTKVLVGNDVASLMMEEESHHLEITGYPLVPPGYFLKK